ncbi:Ni/Fe hydrogenase subunit alpha [Yinghuangia seranimata]|uniref:Ni/Fe hydrogenase subunit alpha n=1 Tax=Yinghuangia seranimata TaxID=408067 RepID=UPI00248AB57C|nr:nickel-dependent hydrogenase large subunit [Yinghuangia seranimata]MDI2130504.1 nickel-dependent hydrogenase large subunit [Yinghuangia seranimata]
MTHRGARMLRVEGLARVEGEGALRVGVEGGTVTDVELQIYEPPRFFEALLRGRAHTEPPDLTARICGICPVAYQMSACRAVEDACGVAVSGPIADLRRLLYCGEWIESHALHVHLLHAPDFLGLDDAVALARADRASVERGLRIKQAGNALVERIGGRAIHPVNVRLGGFHRAPDRAELAGLVPALRKALDDALETAAWVGGFDYPDDRGDQPFLALSDPAHYAIDAGTPTVLRADGREARPFPLTEFEQRVVETQVSYSTALRSTLDGERHLTGPLARYAVNGRQLSAPALDAARAAGLGDIREGEVCRNPYRSIGVRAVETVYALGEALRIIEAYRPPPRPYEPVPARAGTGRGATEAPRGLLYHRYRLDADGLIEDACIVPPTAQNQGAIEDDLRRIAQAGLDLPDEALTRCCERAVRNHDPCISCSTHFLDLTVERK